MFLRHSRGRALTLLQSSSYSGSRAGHYNRMAASASGPAEDFQPAFPSAAVATLAAFLAVVATTSSSEGLLFCEHPAHTNATFTPASVAKEDWPTSDESSLNDLPIYTSRQLAENNGENGRPVWMSYGGIVYDVTAFLSNHPGGSEKIMLAAGTAIEPFWYLYRQHYNSDLPLRLMEHMAIGHLNQNDQDAVDAEMEILEKTDPYAREPLRHKALRVHSDAPMNAEVPAHLLTRSYLTPNSLFYIRHHHPVPFLSEKLVQDYRLVIDASSYGTEGKILSFSLAELKEMPKTEVNVTLQCSGNRRSGFNAFERTSGTPWGQGAISTATFGGVRLRDLLKAAGLDDPEAAQDEHKLEHVRFSSLDGMMASIGIEKACSPYGDVIVAYEMNGEELPRDHGFPLRVVVPGYAAVRSVKWLSHIQLAETEAEGPWQRGLNYKTLPPGVSDANTIDLDQMPSMTEMSLFSGITNIHLASTGNATPGDRVTVQAKGWALSGGGRNIVRVDVTGDEGKSWATAQLRDGSKQRFGRAWAWTFWECDIPAVVREDGTVRLASKAVDVAFNVQPESCQPSWNVRGLGNNSWYQANATVCTSSI
jgi:sulfite oxidase